MIRPKWALASSILMAAAAWSQTSAPPAAAAHPDGAEVRFDVTVHDAPAQVFFQGLADGTPYNMLVQPDVTGPISLTLKHVTIEQALDAARDVYGYDYRRTSSGFLVLPATIQSRIFHLNYLDVERYGTSKTRISSGQVSQEENSAYNNSSTTGGAITVPAAHLDQNGKPSLDPNSTAVVTSVNSDFWGAIETDLKTIVGPLPGRSLVINRQSGIIMVRAMPRELRDVENYLQRTTDSVGRQVVLEARIVEVQLNHAYQAGINWAKIAQAGGANLFLGQSAPPAGFTTDPLTPQGNTVTVSPGNLTTGFLQSTLGGAFTVAANFSNFNAFIELLSTQGQTRVLSSPRVSTMQNQKAIIKAGSDQFFVTGVTSNTVTGTATSTSNNVQLTPFFSGVALDVTPQIDEDGNVILHVHPAVSEVTDQVTTLNVQGTVDVLPLALSQIRESDSIVRAHSGQLIVIGGLMRETRDNIDYKTPFLGDIPYLGKLFRSEQKQSTTSELVILLRPIVVTDADWPTLVKEPTERVEELERQGHLQ
jgi:MSHA biogenesis protein MshL